MSGLTKRVRGANAPQAPNAADVRGGNQAATPVTPASIDVVTSLLEHLTNDVDRESDR